MSKFNEDHERDMADPEYQAAYTKEQALLRARLLLVAYHQAQDEACDRDGEVCDWYAWDRCYTDFGEDALETLQHLVDALNAEEDEAQRQDGATWDFVRPAPEPGEYGYEAEDGDEEDA